MHRPPIKKCEKSSNRMIFNFFNRIMPRNKNKKSRLFFETALADHLNQNGLIRSNITRNYSYRCLRQ